MKIENKLGTGRNRAGILLLEALLYIGLFAVVITIAITAYHRFSFQSRRLQQNATDISRVLPAGERWRADIRGATVEPIPEENEPSRSVRIRGARGEIVYIFREGTILRRVGTGPETVVLEQVKTSLMEPVRRRHVTSWQWQLELKGRDNKFRVRPLFHFQAVPKP